jgi:hypothetical protein
VHTYENGTSPAWASTRWARRAWAATRSTSVLNANNQVWDAPNVFVTDGACMTSAACQNPSLTYMALTARAADFAVNELIGGEVTGAEAITADAPAHYFRMMKELALLGYFTSEIGYTQAMRYVETPGRFDPCVPYAPGEQAWAPHA